MNAARIGMKIALRSYQPVDFEILHRIDQACYSADTAYSRADLRTYLDFVGAECIVAEIEESVGRLGAQDGEPEAARVVGFCIGARRGDHGHIITMDVLTDFRRNGVGGALLAEIERRMIATGVERVGLETATDNDAGIAFWRRHGYVSVGVKKGYYAGRRDAYYMTKAMVPSEEPPKATPGARRRAPGRGGRSSERKR
jgi:ribosomal protein S18 acetylase RimI-like enzyme